MHLVPVVVVGEGGRGPSYTALDQPPLLGGGGRCRIYLHVDYSTDSSWRDLGWSQSHEKESN